MLCSKQPVYYNETTIDRRTHNSAALNDIADLNINERITKFQNQLKNEFVYRIPLRYITDLGKINFPPKIYFRIKCHLETEMKKLFESKATVGAPDPKIIFTKTSFIQYKQFLLDKNLRQYLETIMVSKKILSMLVQKTPTEKTYEIGIGSDSITIDFFWLKQTV